MTQFQEPRLGTPREARISTAIQRTGAFLVGDRFLAGYYSDSLRIVEELGPLHRLLLAKKGVELGANPKAIEGALSNADDVIRWAAQMREENYHTINTHVFISLWAAQEAGNENIIAAIISTIKDAAIAAAGKFPSRRYEVGDWPWPEERCLEIAQKLDSKAKDKTSDGGWNVVARLATLYGWLGVGLEVDEAAAAKYNEASLVRNVIVHRYGRLGPTDIAHAGNLRQWVGKPLPMTNDRLHEYHEAIVAVHLATSKAVWARGWK